jgi:sugar lactone lactonase YvrE
VPKLRFFSILLIVALSVAASAQIALNKPNGLAFDHQGNLYVANYGTSQVLIYSPSLTQINSISTGLNGPDRLAFDVQGNLYVSNAISNNITVYNASLQQVPARTINQNVDLPMGVAVDVYGDVYVANNSPNTITVYDVSGNLVGTLSSDTNGRKFSAPGAMAIYGRDLYVGTGPTAGPNYVTSYNVGQFLTLKPNEIETYTDTVNTGPTGVAFDKAGNVYISASHWTDQATFTSPTNSPTRSLCMTQMET